jgi:putative component of membrane protein insertase Oxa1/YidC/SpoIIIJ protein YidD
MQRYRAVLSLRCIVALNLLLTAGANALAAENELGQFLAAPATLALSVYKRYISPAKGTSCPMEPSDSTYASQAISRYGLFRGILMTADRLHRCGHDVGHYEIVRTGRGLKYFDPIDPSESNP